MKQGRTLQELAVELSRQTPDVKKDYLVEQGAAVARVVEGEVVFEGINGRPLSITPYAHRQFADYLGIPARYYSRMQAEQPALLAESLNTWHQQNAMTKRLYRTLDGSVRANLSPRYRVLDNRPLGETVIPKLLAKGVQILSCELTETRMYIKGILESLSDELPEGVTWGHGHHNVGRDGRIVAAITISNSEVGNGRLSVIPSVFTTWCTNLAQLHAAAMKQFHVGRGLSADDNFEVFRDETREADDRAFFLKVSDVVDVALSEEAFNVAIGQIREGVKAEIRSKALPKVVEVAVKDLALPESSADSILNFLSRGGDFTRWGLSSAITATANEAGDYETATSLEAAGGELLAMDGPAWQRISEAA